ncbi:MAG: Clp protease N-terminal domain-containing protein [Verrucomicrobiae bacterium]|nr:Clp protease N-terminal domain-containing protein [Verrucomicrobiae bacterium]
MEATPQCRQAIEYASAAQSRFGHACLSSGHLIYGLLAVNRGVAEVLRNVGLTLELAEHHLQSHPFRVEDMVQHRGLLCGQSAMTAFMRAEQEASKTACRSLGTDHVLLAICGETNGAAVDMFDAHKIDRAKMRELLIKRLSAPPSYDFSTLDGLCGEE